MPYGIAIDGTNTLYVSDATPGAGAVVQLVVGTVLDERHVELVGQPHQVDQHVGHLVADLHELLQPQLIGAAMLQPLEMLQQFSRFD